MVTVRFILWVVCLCHVGVHWLNAKWIELFFLCEGYHSGELICIILGPGLLADSETSAGSGVLELENDTAAVTYLQF